MQADIEWDENKNRANLQKHGISFEIAQHVFTDPKRVVVLDKTHSIQENRFFCFGKIKGEIVTVRFTHRHNKIRIFGAGFWRKGRKHYEKQNQIH
jgi:uncharacterized protein